MIIVRDAAAEAAFAFDEKGAEDDPASSFAVFVAASSPFPPVFATLVILLVASDPAIDFHVLTRAFAFGPNAGCFLNLVTTFPINV